MIPVLNFAHSQSNVINPSQPFTIRTRGNCVVKITKSSNNDSYWPAVSVLSSIDKGSTWTNANVGTDMRLNDGDLLWLKGTTTTWSAENEDGPRYYSLSTNNYGKLDIGGNIFSLTNFTMPSNAGYLFQNFFWDVENLERFEGVLPCRSGCNSIYANMFYNCRGLKYFGVNTLSSTTLQPGCYQAMFNCCYLTQMPNLPATTLATNCYLEMFAYNALKVGYIPALTLNNQSCRHMFYGCGQLHTLKISATDINYTSCLEELCGLCPSLSCIEVNFTNWCENKDATKNWMFEMGLTGIFICPNDLPLIHDSSHIPVGWTVVRKGQ